MNRPNKHALPIDEKGLRVMRILEVASNFTDRMEARMTKMTAWMDKPPTNADDIAMQPEMGHE